MVINKTKIYIVLTFEELKLKKYRVSLKSFPDHKHLLQENYVENKHNFLPLLKLVSKLLCHVFIVTFGFWMQHFQTGGL